MKMRKNYPLSDNIQNDFTLRSNKLGGELLWIARIVVSMISIGNPNLSIIDRYNEFARNDSGRGLELETQDAWHGDKRVVTKKAKMSEWKQNWNEF